MTGFLPLRLIFRRLTGDVIITHAVHSSACACTHKHSHTHRTLRLWPLCCRLKPLKHSAHIIGLESNRSQQRRSSVHRQFKHFSTEAEPLLTLLRRAYISVKSSSALSCIMCVLDWCVSNENMYVWVTEDKELNWVFSAVQTWQLVTYFVIIRAQITTELKRLFLLYLQLCVVNRLLRRVAVTGHQERAKTA